MGLNLPSGIPFIYELDENLMPVSLKFLGDKETVKKAIAVTVQGKATKILKPNSKISHIYALNLI